MKTQKSKCSADMRMREDIFQYAKKHYRTLPEYLWKNSPNAAVLRHSENKKWYGLIMDISRDKLGLSENGIVDILNVKCDPDLICALRTKQGFLPAYHMNRTYWISILLDGSVDTETVFSLLNMSYDLTGSKSKKPKPAK